MLKNIIILAILAICLAPVCVSQPTKEESEQAKVIAQLANRIDVLDRKVAGMQKCITKLFAVTHSSMSKK